MDISLLSTTRDPEQLRALAIAMVQKAMAESQNLANVVQEKGNVPGTSSSQKFSRH